MSGSNMNDPSVQWSASDVAIDPTVQIGLISADSHITEPPNCYVDHIDPSYRDRAPRMVKGANGGDVFIVEEMARPIPMGIVAAAGIDPKLIRVDEAQFEDLHRGGWDPEARLADQDRDGIVAEIIYPSIGMALCNHPDPGYKRACFTAYNRWLEEFQGAAPTRLYGVGQTAVTSIAETIADLEDIKAKGMAGAMMPCDPSTEFDYDDVRFDPVWQAAIDLRLPLSFHILTSGKGSKGLLGMSGRGDKVSSQSHTVIRANQDVIALLIWGRVFERFPALKVVCAEADAGWAPHFMYRMDHFYKRHRYWSKTEEMARMPSDYFLENIYLTFQDDWSAFAQVHNMNPRRLLWANDFPHSDSTWPISQAVLTEHGASLDAETKRRILRDNTIELYGMVV